MEPKGNCQAWSGHKVYLGLSCTIGCFFRFSLRMSIDFETHLPVGMVKGPLAQRVQAPEDSWLNHLRSTCLCLGVCVCVCVCLCVCVSLCVCLFRGPPPPKMEVLFVVSLSTHQHMGTLKSDYPRVFPRGPRGLFCCSRLPCFFCLEGFQIVTPGFDSRAGGVFLPGMYGQPACSVCLLFWFVEGSCFLPENINVRIV